MSETEKTVRTDKQMGVGWREPDRTYEGEDVERLFRSREERASFIERLQCDTARYGRLLIAVVAVLLWVAAAYVWADRCALLGRCSLAQLDLVTLRSSGALEGPFRQRSLPHARTVSVWRQIVRAIRRWRMKL